MNQNEVRAQFKEEWDAAVKANPALKTDKPAKSEAWGVFLDGLCKDGKITDKQYNNMQMEPTRKPRAKAAAAGADVASAPAAPILHLQYEFKSSRHVPTDGSGRKHTVTIFEVRQGHPRKEIIKRTAKFVSAWQLARDAIRAAKIMPPEAFREDGELMSPQELYQKGIAMVESV